MTAILVTNIYLVRNITNELRNCKGGTNVSKKTGLWWEGNQPNSELNIIVWIRATNETDRVVLEMSPWELWDPRPRQSHTQSFILAGTADMYTPQSIAYFLHVPIFFATPQHVRHRLRHPVALGSTAVWLHFPSCKMNLLLLSASFSLQHLVSTFPVRIGQMSQHSCYQYVLRKYKIDKIKYILIFLYGPWVPVGSHLEPLYISSPKNNN